MSRVSGCTGEKLAVERLVRKLERHDAYTAAHSGRVSSLALLVGKMLDLDGQHLEIVRTAGLVHDVGKIGVPHVVLNKTDRLDDDEFAQIRLHSIIGGSIVGAIPELEHLMPIVLHHHERWDGRGYPTGLAGVDIPLESRLIFVADAFDAMTTNRPYGRVMPAEEALNEIESCAGRQFDPMVVDALLKASRRNLLNSV